MQKREKMVLKIAGSSTVSGVAGSIVKAIEDNKQVEIHTIGASATNQGMKSLAVARGVLATKGLNLSVIPGFGTTDIEGKDRTMLIFKLIIE